MDTPAHLAHWADIEPLLDQALALPPAERERFLDNLPPAQQRWREVIAELLRHEADAARAGFLSLAASLPGFATNADSAATAPAAPHKDQVVGPWLLLEELGRGGMASVWLARRQDGDFQREVALKLPHSPSPLWADRFRRERDILARLSHPGIARLFDAGLSPEGLPWLAMERVQGRDILAWCEQHRASVRQRVELLLQIADALQYAHSQLVVHRDIKPANVLVQDDGQVRLLDFGIARLLASDGDADPALTQVGQRPMTPEYASPEQVRGEEPGIASDVYALGVLAYRLLSGASPYAKAMPASRHALERAVLEMQPPAPSAAVTDASLRKSLHGDLDTILLKALAKEPGHRYATVDALASDLRRYLDGMPVLARAASWRYVAARFVSRHRAGVATSALALFGLVSTTGWALWSTRQAHVETQRAEAMYGFVVGLFNPDQNQVMTSARPDMPLKEIVEHGSRRILTQLQDQPDARERLLHDLIPLTEQMGLMDLSKTLGQNAVDTALHLHGQDSMAYANALVDQLQVFESTGQYQQGYDKADEALRIYERLRQQDPYKLASVNEKLGGFGFRIHAPNREDAQHLERAIALMVPLKQQNTLGQTYLLLDILRTYLGDVAGGYAAAQSAVDAYRRLYGKESWQAAQAENLLGSAAEMLRRPSEAEALQRHSIAATRQIQGPDSIGVARAESSLAVMLFAGAHRNEARQLMADALRITHLPANAGYGGLRDMVQVQSLILAARVADLPTLREGCASYEAGSMQSTNVSFFSNLAQACSAAAIDEGNLALAQKWLSKAAFSYEYFAKAPGWTAGLEVRRGELAWSRGDKQEALNAWRHSLALGNIPSLPPQVRAWWLIANNDRMDTTELQRMRSFRKHLEEAGGERYYAEYLAQLRQAEEAQARFAART